MPKFKLTSEYLLSLYLQIFKKNREIDTIRASWGREVHKDRDFKTISTYHCLLNDSRSKQAVDENTWNDLNMNSIFSKIDRNVSQIGSQYLYHLLHAYEENSTLTERAKRYRIYLKQDDLREKILLQLNRLRHKEAAFLPCFIFKEAPKRPQEYYIIYFLSFLIMLSTALNFFNSIFVFPTVGLMVVNLLVSRFYSRKVTSYSSDLSNLSILLDIGVRLSENDHKGITQLAELGELRSFATTLNKKIGWLSIDETRLNEFGRAIVAYLNYFWLFNLVAFVRSIQVIGDQQGKIQQIFELVASLDAEISITSYLENLPYYCRPRFNMKNHIEVREIYHPLLADPVSNSFHLQNKSALITGSNMAGKTTFIKTIGVNIILGQTIAICLAREACLPQSAVRTSIKRTDDIGDNKSYYFKEIEAILEFMKIGSHQNGFVFLIDEIFRGTNTVERIAAATSVLRQLSRNNLSLVTTHDVELQKLLVEDFGMYHFCEQIEDGIHFFNYRIQNGPTSSHNAIRLLEIKGFPKNVVQEAHALAEKFAQNGSFE